MAPRLSSICRFVDAVTHRKIGPLQTLAAANINDVWTGRRDSYITDRAGRLIIKDRHPCAAIIVCFPHTAVVYTSIEEIWLARHSHSANGAASSKWPDAAPLHILIKTLIKLLRVNGR